MQIQKAGMLQKVQFSQKNDKFLSKIYEKLATGKKINRASDDAAMLAVAKELEAQTRGYQQSSSNIGDALSALRIAEGAGNEISAMKQRQSELALQASNGTLRDSDREALNSEYQALNEEINRIAEATQFNRQGLTNGSSPLSDGTGQIQAGPNAGDSRTLGAIDYTNLASGDISTIDGANAAIDSTRDELESLTSTRTNIGAEMNSLSSARNNVENQNINVTAALSQAEDLDYAQASMDKARGEILSQSSNYAMSNFNSINKANMSAVLG